MSAANRRAYAYALGRYVSGRTTLDLRAYASEAGMLADRRARCERFERKMKTGRGSFARRLARMTGLDSLRPAAGPMGAASVGWAWNRSWPLAVVMDGMAFYPDRTEYWTPE